MTEKGLKNYATLTLNDYQELADKTAIYRDSIEEYVESLGILNEEKKESLAELLAKAYAILGLCGEAGEIANKFKKVIRDSKSSFTFSDDIGKELGDAQWYISAGAGEYGFELGYIAQNNIEKLTKRKENGTIKGSGDNR